MAARVGDGGADLGGAASGATADGAIHNRPPAQS